MKQTKIHLILILSVVLILLLFASCSEKEPAATIPTTTTETVVTTTAPVTTEDPYAKYEGLSGCAVVDIPITTINEEEIRQILADNFDNFDSEKKYLIYPPNFTANQNTEQAFQYLYLEHGVFVNTAYRFTVDNGNIRLIKDSHLNSGRWFETVTSDFRKEIEDGTLLELLPEYKDDEWTKDMVAKAIDNWAAQYEYAANYLEFIVGEPEPSPTDPTVWGYLLTGSKCGCHGDVSFYSDKAPWSPPKD